MEMSDYKWTEEKVDELITLYEARPCLYDTKSKQYSNRDSRRKALAEIATALATTGKFFATQLATVHSGC